MNARSALVVLLTVSALALSAACSDTDAGEDPPPSPRAAGTSGDGNTSEAGTGGDGGATAGRGEAGKASTGQAGTGMDAGASAGAGAVTGGSAGTVPMPDAGQDIRLEREQHALVAGGERACALIHDGLVVCWGDNMFGNLGVGDFDARGDDPNETPELLPTLELGTGARAYAVALGSGHGCAALESGDVKCWGTNLQSQLGVAEDSTRGDAPGEMGDALQPVPLGSVGEVATLAAGGVHTCALFVDGRLKCWGYDNSGQLGIGDRVDRGLDPSAMGDALPFVELGTGRHAIDVVAAMYHTCALLNDHSVKCWGFDNYGGLGYGDTDDRGGDPDEMGDALPAIQLGTGRSAIAIGCGTYRTCALLDDHSVKCWGEGMFGALGYGDTENRGDGPDEMGDALPAIDFGQGRTATAIAVGGYQSCALLDDHSVKCWGQGALLGYGDTEERGDEAGEMGDALPVVDLGAGRTAVELIAGGGFFCALLDDGSAKCWGGNPWGELGLGNTESRGDDPGEMGDALPAFDVW